MEGWTRTTIGQALTTMTGNTPPKADASLFGAFIPLVRWVEPPRWPFIVAAFFYVVDMRQWRSWCVPLLWIGMNPITLYLASNVIGFRRQAARFAGGDIKVWLDAHIGAGAGQGMLALVGLALMFVLARFLYERKIFLRV